MKNSRYAGCEDSRRGRREPRGFASSSFPPFDGATVGDATWIKAIAGGQRFKAVIENLVMSELLKTR